MYPNRRRKKRPNYGLRTVEVIRGANGFGFTISGQQPCILSCIVSNSPADQAGLRAGDFLISVNGISVSKMAHDAVVSLIGNCVDPIKMTIAENYYSDSSDEELECGRVVGARKPKYMHKPRQYRRFHKGIVVEPNAKHIEKFRENIVKPRVSANIFNNEVESTEQSHESLNISHPVPMEDEAGPIEFKALVGYLGTIEMPKQLLPSSRLHTVCSCIKKLRQEKRSPTIVLMTILPTCLTLKNASNHIIAIYPTNRVVYVSSTTDKESRYFGLVTSAVSDNRDQNIPKLRQNSDEVDISNSCHVFVVDSKIIDHRVHIEKAENFKIICTPDAVTGSCLEFPQNALYIVNLIQTMYKLQNDTPIKNDLNNPLLANSPQPSASSNSDSGIGYRDDCGNISDRILVVEFPSHRPLPIMNNINRPQGIDGGDLSLNAFDFRQNNDLHFELNNKAQYRPNNLNTNDDGDAKPLNNLNNIRAYENIKNHFESSSALLLKQNNNDFKESNRLTCRALLDIDTESSPYSSTRPFNVIKYGNVDSGQTYSEHPVDVPLDEITIGRSVDGVLPCTSLGNTDFQNSVDNISVQSSKSGEFSNLVNIFRIPFEAKKLKKQSKMVSSCENIETFHDNPKTYDKLSPKVYGVPMANYSCEELNNTELYEEKFCYGSLQDLSNWTNQGQPRRNIAQSEPDVRIHRNAENVETEKSDDDNDDEPLDEQPPTEISNQEGFASLEKALRDGLQSTSVVVALRPVPVTPFKRFHTLGSSRRRIASRFLSKRPLSTVDVRPDDDVDFKNLKCDQNGGGSVGGGRKGGGTEGPASWSTSFEKLLEDPVGLHAFAEFLKKEFSAENIYFWTACERYRRLTSVSERAQEAQRIFKYHLGNGATEAVNVDSQGRQAAEQGLAEASLDLFEAAQKQIFNLMKFDSYPRFLKSQLYKQCLSGEEVAPAVDPRLASSQVTTLSTPSKLKKSLSNAEDRRRKSLLPWHRKITGNQRSKSRDRNDLALTQKSWDGVLTVPSSEENRRLLSMGSSDIHSSHSSLTSLDLAASQDNFKSEAGTDARTALCRVLLSNGSTTVVQIKDGETIQQLVNRLLEKRGLTYSSFEVFTNKHTKALDIAEPSSKLAGCEVTVEQRVVFKLDLPNRKIISVKSKYTKFIVDVLRPILHKYKFSLEQVMVTRAGYPVDVNLPVTTIDNARLNIQLKDDVLCSDIPTTPTIKINNVKISKLEEITNKVFEGILQEKSDGVFKPTRSDKGSVKSEDWGSEHSSGLLGKFLRRDSAVHEKKKKIACQRAKLNGECTEELNAENSQKKPLIAKLKAGANKLHVGTCSESDELVEGLTRAQRRLEDQRGTEINFELPDFLKDKDEENHFHRPLQNTSESSSRYYSSNADCPTKLAFTKSLRQEVQPNYENQNISASPRKVNSQPTSPVKNLNSPEKILDSKSPRADPPPLPPKPKIVPIKPPNWGHTGFYKAKEVPLEKHSEMFLEQPSSSFV